MPPVFIFFGDSICAGSNIPGGGPADAWPMLWERSQAERVQVVNRSRGGRPTDALAEFTPVIAEFGKTAAALVLALGGNDARSLDAGMVARAVANLTTMIDLALAAGIGRVILVGPYNINREALQATYPIRHEREANLISLDAAYRALALARGLEYVPMYGVVPEAAMTADGVHPDRAGNALIARHFAAHIAVG